jgi:hypothetical protein
MVADDMRKGQNVVLCLPEHYPDDLRLSLRDRVKEERHWSPLNAGCEGGERPIDLLFRWFAPECRSGRRDLDTLMTQGSFAGRTIWLDGVDAQVWPSWQAFLREYVHLCQDAPQEDRTLMCIPLVSELALAAPRNDARLSIRTWRDTLDPYDMLLFAARMFGERGDLTSLERQLATSVTAALAQWDPRVVEILAREPLPVIMDPLGPLRALADERGWGDLARADCCWPHGTKGCVDGQDRIHSAVLATCNETRELNRRIWAAEVAVLLPVVEERRVEILDEFGPQFVVPFTVQSGRVQRTINHYSDLEIGDMASQMNQGLVILDRETQRRVQNLTAMRNMLAHLSLVPLQMLHALMPV